MTDHWLNTTSHHVGTKYGFLCNIRPEDHVGAAVHVQDVGIFHRPMNGNVHIKVVLTLQRYPSNGLSGGKDEVLCHTVRTGVFILEKANSGRTGT